MSNVLTKICDDKLEHIISLKKNRSQQSLMVDANLAPATRGFKLALDKKVSSHGTALIAELKKASPSKGLIRENFSPSQLAIEYQTGGAACLSVLTDEPYFQGKNQYLAMARDSVTLPVLRKDFILDTYQVFESRLIGADCILLIMAILSDTQVSELASCAHELQMDVLMEIHDEEELSRVTGTDCSLLGINNRNLKTLEVDISTTERLAPNVPKDLSVVCESGIYTSHDINKVKLSDVHIFLVGESLMRQEDVADATKSLLKN